MNQKQLLALTALGSATVSAAAAYYVAFKQFEKKLDKIVEEEIAQAKEFFARTYKKDDFETPEKAAETLGVSPNLEPAAEAIKNYQGHINYQGMSDGSKKTNVEKVYEITEVSEEDGVIEQNIFKGSDIDRLAVDDRRPDVPYVITLEEFMQNEPEHNQISVTYFEGDQTLADERDDVIEDINETVGRANLMLFGLASGDENVVHVRLEKRSLDFEVNRSTGEYRREVAGFKEEDLRHSDDGRMRRRRPRWDE